MPGGVVPVVVPAGRLLLRLAERRAGAAVVAAAAALPCPAADQSSVVSDPK